VSTTTSTTEPEPTTTTAPPTPEEKVKAAFLKADALASELSRSPMPNDPRLAESYLGASLDKARSVLQGYLDRGVHIEYVDDRPPIPTVESIQLVGPERALVTNCIVDSARQVRTRDSAVINDSVVSRRARTELRFSRGAWLVTAQQGVASWPDGKGCR